MVGERKVRGNLVFWKIESVKKFQLDVWLAAIAVLLMAEEIVMC